MTNNILGAIYFVIFVLLLGGWVANIVKLFGADQITGMEIARIAGVFLAPIGAVLGWF